MCALYIGYMKYFFIDISQPFFKYKPLVDSDIFFFLDCLYLKRTIVGSDLIECVGF